LTQFCPQNHRFLVVPKQKTNNWYEKKPKKLKPIVSIFEKINTKL
jgi:hypothetical protein